jgi:asparagine synthase (glutamine-hydrolysing)
MSGICAVWHKKNPDSVAQTLSRLSGALSLTSTDEAYRATAPFGAGAGVAVQAQHQGQQGTANDRLLLVCDTDLVNGRALMSEFGLSNHTTAQLLAAMYQTLGRTFVDRLRGGFAIALWDVASRQLFAAVDPFGIKRLVVHESSSVIAIASRVDVMRCVNPALAINPRAVVNVLNFSTNLAPETIYLGVRRLKPGTLLVASDDRLQEQQYWDLRYPAAVTKSISQLARGLESTVQQSVADHCDGLANEQIGAYLSGGTDSSTVVGLLTRVKGAPVKAFSIGFEEQGFSELHYARVAAEKFGAEHHTYLVNANDCVTCLPQVVRHFDEPFGNSSAIATYFCGRLAASKGVHTLLAGDGGDELFGGNERYATDKIFDFYGGIPAWLRAGVIEPFANLPVDTTLHRRARGYIRRAKMPGVERMLSFQFLRTHAPSDIFDGEFLASLDGYTVLDVPASHYAAAPSDTHLNRLLYVDMKITIADSDLPKVTRMSDMAGIQSRFPFLDRAVADYAGAIPPSLKVKRLQKRYLFKRAFRGLLPQEVIRKKKHGFGVPVAVWMRTDPRLRELTHDTLRSQRSLERGYFRREFLDELFRKHFASDDTFYGDTLWAFLMLELWHRYNVDQPIKAIA